MAVPTNKRRRKGVQVRMRLLMIVLLVLGIGVGWLIYAIQQTPEWYRPPDRTDERVIQLGHDTQNRVISQMHKVRSQEPPWTFRLENDEINAWLAVNLPGWLELETGKSWPDGVSLPIAYVEEGAVNLGLRFDHAFGGRVVSVRLIPNFESPPDDNAEDDGPQPEDDRSGIDQPMLRLTLDRAAIGRLSIPGGLASGIVSTIREGLGPGVADGDFDALTGILFGERAIDPAVELSDGRFVRVESIDLDAEGATFHCRTVREAAGAIEPEDSQ